jgi:hypothetical protein
MIKEGKTVAIGFQIGNTQGPASFAKQIGTTDGVSITSTQLRGKGRNPNGQAESARSGPALPAWTVSLIDVKLVKSE